ncbi:MAG: hypothetical protein ACHQZQ_07230 [SAR324 cluster bacterium]
MNPYLAILALAALLLASWRFTRPRRRTDGSERGPRPERKVEGFQVWSPLHVKMGRACIQDYGTRFGAGFRRKEGPLLPHDPECRCENVAFVFTGSQTFAGALRHVTEPKSLEPGLPAEAVPKLIAALKRVSAEPVPPHPDAYIALIGSDTLDEDSRPAALAFLRERHRFLTQFLTQASGAPPAHDNDRDTDREQAGGGPISAAAAKTP